MFKMIQFPSKTQNYNYYIGCSAQADSTLTYTSHKDTEQSTIEASATLDGVTETDPVIR
jgi:hypothetical protein